MNYQIKLILSRVGIAHHLSEVSPDEKNEEKTINILNI
jgi:hypothetical protein